MVNQAQTARYIALKLSLMIYDAAHRSGSGQPKLSERGSACALVVKEQQGAVYNLSNRGGRTSPWTVTPHTATHLSTMQYMVPTSSVEPEMSAVESLWVPPTLLTVGPVVSVGAWEMSV